MMHPTDLLDTITTERQRSARQRAQERQPPGRTLTRRFHRMRPILSSSPDVIAASARIWPSGPPTVSATASRTRRVTTADIERFTALSGDRNPLHYDAALATGTRLGGLVVQGGVITAILNAVVAEDLPGPAPMAAPPARAARTGDASPWPSRLSPPALRLTAGARPV